ncbi:MAG TPA: hypothetical protein PL066_00515 [bacterium]|nr:hypothetical protein [bacterium]
MSLLEQIQQKKAVAAEAVKAKAEAEAAEKKEKIEGKKSERAELVTACDRLGEEINGMMSELGEAENIPIDELSAEDKKDIADMISASKLELKNKQGELKNLELKIANLDQDLSSLGAGEQVIQKEEQEKYSVGETVPAPPSAMSQGLEERSLGSVDQKEEEGQKEKEEGVVSFKELPVMSVEEFNQNFNKKTEEDRNHWMAMRAKIMSPDYDSGRSRSFTILTKANADFYSQEWSIVASGCDKLIKNNDEDVLRKIPKESLERMKALHDGFDPLQFIESQMSSQNELNENEKNIWNKEIGNMKQFWNNFGKNIRKLENFVTVRDPEMINSKFENFTNNISDYEKASEFFQFLRDADADGANNIVNVLGEKFLSFWKDSPSEIPTSITKEMIDKVGALDKNLGTKYHALEIEKMEDRTNKIMSRNAGMSESEAMRIAFGKVQGLSYSLRQKFFESINDNDISSDDDGKIFAKIIKTHEVRGENISDDDIYSFLLRNSTKELEQGKDASFEYLESHKKELIQRFRQNLTTIKSRYSVD